MNAKVTVSVGLILALIFATFLVTSFYFETTTLGDRLDKRYNRLSERIDKLENEVYKILETTNTK